MPAAALARTSAAGSSKRKERQEPDLCGGALPVVRERKRRRLRPELRGRPPGGGRALLRIRGARAPGVSGLR